MVSSYKNLVFHKLYDIYKKTENIEQLCNISREMLKSNKHKDDANFLAQVHGEVCETVAVCIIEDYMKKNSELTKNWFYTKGTILKDPKSNNPRYYTELDVTLFTPQIIYALECKCYAGDKVLKKDCTIRRGKYSTDVYNQHKKHVEVLINNVDSARINKDLSGYQLILFNFSEGSLVDKRDDESRKRMLCLDENNLINVFNYFSKTREVVWDINALTRFMKIIESKKETLAEKHMKYVLSLKDKRK